MEEPGERLEKRGYREGQARGEGHNFQERIVRLQMT